MNEVQYIGIGGKDLPPSESELSERSFGVADAPRASGRPPGNAALAATFLPPNENNHKRDLTIQTSQRGQLCEDNSPFLVSVMVDVGAGSAGGAASASFVSQTHLTWICFVFRSSRQCSH